MGENSKMAAIMFAPKARTSWSADGELLTHGNSHSDCIQLLQTAISIAKAARGHAGAGTSDAPLTEEENKRALAWLKKKFESSCINNAELAWYAQQYRDNLLTTRQDKEWTRKQLHTSFRAFKKEVFGDASLCESMIRFGNTSPEQIRCVLSEFHRLKTERLRSQNAPQHTCEVSSPAESNQLKDLRKDAQAKREAYRYGRRLNEQWEDGSLSKMSEASRHCLMRFQTGELRREMIEANKRYGHGVGCPVGLSLAQFIHIESQFRDLTEYMRS